jgi:anaerobic C4-dicarboxylate transporter DcuA
MDWKLVLQFLGRGERSRDGRSHGRCWARVVGAVGLLVLVVGFDVAPANIPGEVLLIVLTVIMAASAMEVAGGIDFLVRVAEQIIRKNPKQTPSSCPSPPMPSPLPPPPDTSSIHYCR